jgi:hypothetical protein
MACDGLCTFTKEISDSRRGCGGGSHTMRTPRAFLSQGDATTAAGQCLRPRWKSTEYRKLPVCLLLQYAVHMRNSSYRAIYL